MATKQHDDPTQEAPQTDLPDFFSIAPAEQFRLLKLEAIRAYDDFGEVVSLHHWTYDALQAQLTGDIGFEPEYHGHGLSLLLDWLKLRDKTAKDNLRQMIEHLQSLADCNLVEEPRPLYSLSDRIAGAAIH